MWKLYYEMATLHFSVTMHEFNLFYFQNVKFAPSYLVKGIGNNVDKANSKDISKDE